MSCELCNLNLEEKRKGILVMLQEDALDYYTNNLTNMRTYKEVENGLIAWFTSEEQRSRILQEWNSTKLSEWISKNPGKSQLE